jgi:hypothetical protein
MNPTDDLDRRIERWLGESAPSGAPVGLVDTVLHETSSLPQQSRRGLRFSPLFKIGAAVVVVALAIAVGFGAGQLMPSGVGEATASASPSASPTLEPSASASPSAEPSATPSPAPTATPAAGGTDLLLAFTQACDVTPTVLLPTTTILQDGRVIWQENGPTAYQWRVRQLSEAGLSAVRARIAATGLLDQDGDYRPELREGVTDPPGHGLCLFTFDHPDGQTDVSVSSVSWFGDEEEAAYYQPAPERRELDTFAQQLRSPETWLAPADWADAESVPYVADAFLVLASPAFGEETGPDLQDVDWPFEASPSSYGEEAGLGDPRPRCAVASRDAVEAYVAGQVQPGGEPIDLTAPATNLNLREGETWYTITLWSVPGADADCSLVS